MSKSPFPEARTVGRGPRGLCNEPRQCLRDYYFNGRNGQYCRRKSTYFQRKKYIHSIFQGKFKVLHIDLGNQFFTDCYSTNSKRKIKKHVLVVKNAFRNILPVLDTFRVTVTTAVTEDFFAFCFHILKGFSITYQT
jgi:hypothetical protein